MDKDPKNWFDILSAQTLKLTRWSGALSWLAESLSIVGLRELSKQLYVASEDLVDIASDIKEAQALVVNERYQQAQESSANMVKVALAIGEVNE